MTSDLFLAIKEEFTLNNKEEKKHNTSPHDTALIRRTSKSMQHLSDLPRTSPNIYTKF
jgi:hypothetical protein